MALCTQTQALLDANASGTALDYSDLSIDAFRRHFVVPVPAALPDAVAAVDDIEIAGPGGAMRLRVYRPDGVRPWPITLYFHGGGFVVGDVATTDHLCRTLCACAQTVVVSVDYRLAPEAPFPAALDDAIAASEWVADHAARLGGLAHRIAVAGDSSGGNLAAVVAQLSATRVPRVHHQLLLYPVLDAAFDTASYRAYASGYFLTRQMMQWFWQQYLPHGADWRDPLACPLSRADLRGTPPATIVVAGCDVLRSEAEHYAQRLQQAGVRADVQLWQGQIHGFLLLQGVLDDADRALATAALALRRAFAQPG
jgi:acetyl esterase